MRLVDWVRLLGVWTGSVDESWLEGEGEDCVRRAFSSYVFKKDSIMSLAVFILASRCDSNDMS